jgi:hypothetical protein
MTTAAAAALLNLLGYITGLSLYTMLLVMLLRGPRAPSVITDRLPPLTALLGLAWNLGALLGLGMSNFGGGAASALLGAAAFTALGFLPAVVVHSVLRSGDAWRRPMTMGMLIAAYIFSAAASALHFYQALTRQTTPSHWALHILTAGFSALIIALLAATRGRPGWGGAGWVLALAVFAVSAVHLSHHDGREYPWWVELAGHHASLPLALVILYQDYRFALADIFLKRALSLVLLVGLAFGLYLNIAAPALERQSDHPVAIGLVLGLWVVTALAYPWLGSAATWFVDVVVLRRTDYEALRAEIAQSIALLEAPEQVLDETCARLAEALTARKVTWSAVNNSSGEECETPATLLPQLLLPSNPSKPDARATTILATTAEPPEYRLTIGEMAGGRRLMSDDVAFHTRTLRARPARTGGHKAGDRSRVASFARSGQSAFSVQLFDDHRLFDSNSARTRVRNADAADGFAARRSTSQRRRIRHARRGDRTDRILPGHRTGAIRRPVARDD